MGLFDVTEKIAGPYHDDSANLIYNLLFCDNLDLYRKLNIDPNRYPWDILLAEKPAVSELQNIVYDDNLESRAKILSYNRLTVLGRKPDLKEILAVIVEVGLEDGLDVIASFRDGTARYINQTGKTLIWETTTAATDEMTDRLFEASSNIVNKIGKWDNPRKPYPAQGMLRISFLVSDGLYFGEGPLNVLFNDPLANPALNVAGELMTYLIESVIGKEEV